MMKIKLIVFKLKLPFIPAATSNLRNFLYFLANLGPILRFVDSNEHTAKI